MDSKLNTKKLNPFPFL